MTENSYSNETYYHGDASSYEEYLDQLTRQKKMPVVSYDSGYMSDPSPYFEQPNDVVSTIFYSLNAKKQIYQM